MMLRLAYAVAAYAVALAIVLRSGHGHAQTHRGPRGPRGFPGADGTAGASVLVDRTVFTDPVFGNDHTGKVQDPNHPFKTMTKALDTVSALHPRPSATNVWQLQARPGIYTETVELHVCINLLGVSTANQGGEVILNGTMSDSLIVSSECVPQVNNIVIQSLNQPAFFFEHATLVSLENVDAQVVCTAAFVRTQSCGAGISELTSLDIRQSRFKVTSPGVLFGLLVLSANLDFTDSEVVLLPQGSHFQATFLGVTGFDLYSYDFQALLQSRNNLFTVTAPFNVSDSQVAMIAVSTADATSQADQLVIDSTTTRLANVTIASAGLAYQGGTQSASVSNLLVRFTPGTEANVRSFYTMNNNKLAVSSGFFNNLRLDGWTGAVPTQTTPNLGNEYLQVNTLTNTQAGGDNLLGVRLFSTSQVVGDIDAVLVWQGTVAAGKLQLPLASHYPGRQVTVKLSTLSGLKALNVTTTNKDRIDTQAWYQLSPVSPAVTPTHSITVVSDGLLHWFVIATT